jgi:MipA family protein
VAVELMRARRLRVRPGRAVLVGLAWLGLAGHPALAEELPLWELGAGAGLLRLPHYRGADQSHSWVLPVPYAVYRGDIFRADRDGARAVLLEGARYDFDLSVAAGPPTRSRDNQARRGMADLDPTFELGPNLNLELARGAGWSLDLRLPVRAAFTVGSSPRYLGVNAEPRLNVDLEWQGWNLGGQVGALWAQRRVHAYVYDVTPAEALVDRPAYRAAGGFSGWQLTFGVSRRQGSTWHGAFVRLDQLDGAAFQASPLVRQRQAVAFGYAVSWVLRTSNTLVSVPN